MEDSKKLKMVNILAIKKANDLIKENSSSELKKIISLVEINATMREFILFAQREKDLIPPALLEKINAFLDERRESLISNMNNYKED